MVSGSRVDSSKSGVLVSWEVSVSVVGCGSGVGSSVSVDVKPSATSAREGSVGWILSEDVEPPKSGIVVESTSVVSFRPVVSLAIPENRGKSRAMRDATEAV